VNAAVFRLRTNDAVGHSTPQQLLKDALAAQRRGAIGDAKRLYASVLSIDPTNAAAFGNLGIIAAQQGDLGAAERLFRQEIKVRPADPAGYNNLGSVLQLQARPADAGEGSQHQRLVRSPKIDRKYRGGLRTDVANLAIRTEASRIFDRKCLRGQRRPC
jgi:Flp pilus assembly protein TadD